MPDTTTTHPLRWIPAVEAITRTVWGDAHGNLWPSEECPGLTRLVSTVQKVGGVVDWNTFKLGKDE